MKGLDVLVVRFLPVVLCLVTCADILLALSGKSVVGLMLIHGNSAIYAGSMFLISLSNKKYHCVWNRLLYAVLVITPVANVVDYKTRPFENSCTYLVVLLFVYLFSMFFTIFNAAKHYKNARRKKKKIGSAGDSQASAV